MHRVIAGVVVLLLALPAMRADDPPKEPDKPASPAGQYKSLLKEYQEARLSFEKTIRAAKSPEERTKQFDKDPAKDFAPKFLDFAEKNSKSPVAEDALIWVMTNNMRTAGIKEVRAKAMQILLRDYLQSEKLASVCQRMAFGMDKQSEAFLRAVLEKNKSAEVRAEACLALAQFVTQKAMLVKRIKDEPAIATALQGAIGKEETDELAKSDLAKTEAESERVFRELADNHIAQLKPDRLMSLLQSLRFAGKGANSLLRTLLEKDSRSDVKGAACLTLAQALKQQADDMPDNLSKEAEKLRAESEKLFELAAEKYAEVKFMRGTIGKVAKRELFDLRNLSVGKMAPAVEGQDQDGQKFKLSDYVGKVVLLDFWSEF